MLKELHISNYRLFDDLTIPDLGQVNLIAGKNNTGKTALLEALRIWAAYDVRTVINHLLKNRGQFEPNMLTSFDLLFNQNNFNGNNLTEIKINDLLIEKKIIEAWPYIAYGIEKGGMRNMQQDLSLQISPDHPQDQAIFVPFNNLNFPLQDIWDKIALTPLEEEAIEILKIIEPRLLRIEVKWDNSRVLLKGDTSPVSLKSLGEGVSRMLWLAAALVSAKESLLLIDELEAGLHHSVQQTLWEKIFQYAKKWNIQVFVTTHSMDAVRTFHEVAERPENIGLGKYFRLQRGQKGQIEAVSYNEEELTTALEFDLETR